MICTEFHNTLLYPQIKEAIFFSFLNKFPIVITHDYMMLLADGSTWKFLEQQTYSQN